MVNIDTYKIVIPAEAGHISDESHYDTAKYKPILDSMDGEIFEVGSKYLQNHRGLNYINQSHQGLKIHGSFPNFMGNNPKDLGNKTNFHLMLNKLADVAGLEINIPMAMQHGFFCLVHTTKDIDLGSPEEVDRTIEMLSILNEPMRYRARSYVNRANKKNGYAGLGIKFDRDVKQDNRNTHQLKFYNKGAEVSCKNPGAFTNEIAGILRAEAQLPTFYTIRQRCGCKDTMIANVLNAPLCPVYEIGKEILRNSKIVNPDKPLPCYGLKLANLNEINMNGLTMKDMRLTILARTLISTYGPNEKAIRDFFIRSGQTKQAASKEIKKLRPYIQKANRDALKVEHGGSWGLNEITNFIEHLKRA